MTSENIHYNIWSASSFPHSNIFQYIQLLPDSYCPQTNATWWQNFIAGINWELFKKVCSGGIYKYFFLIGCAAPCFLLLMWLCFLLLLHSRNGFNIKHRWTNITSLFISWQNTSACSDMEHLRLLVGHQVSQAQCALASYKISSQVSRNPISFCTEKLRQHYSLEKKW